MTTYPGYEKGGWPICCPGFPRPRVVILIKAALTVSGITLLYYSLPHAHWLHNHPLPISHHGRHPQPAPGQSLRWIVSSRTGGNCSSYDCVLAGCMSDTCCTLGDCAYQAHASNQAP